ncbi:MAG TPA: type I methionyl aminopeptidase [Azospirillaceae bacterium]|nr:type I methionyl aminopeptidase [Azospirillaceae bacterium]
MLDHVIEYVTDPDGGAVPIYGPEAFEGMRKAGRLVAECLDFIIPHVQPGVTTGHLDRLIEMWVRDHGAVSATIGYKGYTKASCISVNHVVNHGIPSDDKRLANGDIVNIDVTLILDGWYGDTSRMFLVGDKVGVRGRKLVDVTYDGMMAGIAEVAPGKHLGDVGAAIMEIAHANRFSVVTEFCGHGIGHIFHQAPQVMHVGLRNHGLVLQPGMVFTIEPMINAGRPETKVLADGWTAVTRDRSLSAQFEHQVGVTETGVEIFTLSPKGLHRPPYAV